MHVNWGGQTQVLLEKNVFNKGGYLFTHSPKMQQFRYWQLTHFAPYFIIEIPQNAAISLLTHFAPYFIQGFFIGK